LCRALRRVIVRRQEGWGNERAFDDDRLHSAGAFVVSIATASGARTSGTTSTASTKKCSEYTYGGVEANQVRAGARAKITLKQTAKVAWGHAAARRILVAQLRRRPGKADLPAEPRDLLLEPLGVRLPADPCTRAVVALNRIDTRRHFRKHGTAARVRLSVTEWVISFARRSPV